MRRLTRWLAWILLITWAPDAMAANRALRRAKRAYEQLEYDKVTPLLNKALETASEPAEEVEIYALLATMHVMYGRDAKAEQAFVHVLERQPDFELPPDSSPKLHAAFAAAEVSFAEKPEVDPVERATGDDESDTATTTTTDDVEEPKDVERDPMTELPPPAVAEPSPFYTTWWFWTAVGVVVAGAAGTTTYLLSRPRFPETAFGPYDL